MKKYNHNQILTDNKSIEIGRKYAYFEEFPTVIACVEVIEDNSDDEFIKLKLKVAKGIHPTMQGKEGYEFDVSAKKGLYSYPGMWTIKNFNMINLASSMSPAKDLSNIMSVEHAKSVCKMGAGGGQCCRYLTMGSDGFECARLDESFAKEIDERADNGKMNAISKNCDGYGK